MADRNAFFCVSVLCSDSLKEEGEEEEEGSLTGHFNWDLTAVYRQLGDGS